ncbi:MAG: hypothetical protein EXS47_00630 [Candidatus Zambryskibacteria bacterium]|nr:hypothetical protein [Candidatus Zambryskibacteria bacterium]
MNTLSIFPDLLTFNLLAPALLRLACGLFLLYLGWERYKKPYKWSLFAYVIVGILLILGLYTQIAVIVALIILKFDFWESRKTTSISREKYILQVMVNVVLISLLFTGPGFLAFDLPL